MPINPSTSGAVTRPMGVEPPVAEVAAPVWVLLRGLSRESGHWGVFPEHLLRELRALQPTARLVMLDLPGTGALRRQASPTQVSAIVDACRAQLERQGVSAPVSLIGMSLGAAVLSDWANRYPKEVEAGVLINPSLRPFSELFRKSRPLNYLGLLLLSLSRFSARMREERVLSLTTRLTPTQAVIERWVELQRQHPLGVRNTARQLLASMRYRASRTRPSAPMLLLCSKADSLVDWRCSQAISRAWGAPLRLHTKAGHDLPLDDPQWVAKAVAEWLRDRSIQGVVAGEWH
ncbi:pimeloyl-ACP methyl ester carboxylesterase [Pelomonas saccharophila]|uniref:Pimeloyl-ACP methyl ester carboxylesterase n=1 Tax=Roseateles saccharophilus TaxID=304 RepID=A0ABU1YFL7_ROSSA|nr:alpha/beta hydrolase [Roseateles saccharophilus]MDR7267648.1 pimeloyl-ACP methyl ester carboxylesterase [Roseateles saccharophilus]